MNKTKKEILKLFALILIITGIAFSAHYFRLSEIFNLELIQKTIFTYGIIGPLVFLILYCITSLIFFPAVILSTASGAIWGPYLGTIYTVISATFASIIPFIISRKFGRHSVENLSEKSKFIYVCDNFISKNSLLTIYIMRLIPVFPWDILNYGFGLCKIKIRDYVLATCLGIIPGSYIYNLLGFSVTSKLNLIQIISVIILGLSGFVLLILSKRFFDNYLNK